MGSVHGKVAVITGAANGVGEEVARRLHDRGAKLVLTDVDEALLKSVASRLSDEKGLPRRLALMDAEVEKLGRSMSARTEALENR